MPLPPHSCPAPDAQWVLLANAARARCFARDPATGQLHELASFTHAQSRQRASELGADRPGHAMKGEASTRLEPHTEPHTKHRAAFARELADYLDAAALAHQFAQVSILASRPFLGDLREQLGDASRRCLAMSHAVDLTELQGRELETRVTTALRDHAH